MLEEPDSIAKSFMTTFCSRFQLLRELIPANDQKRDRASFLLEVNLGKGEEEASNDHDLLSCAKLIMEAQHKPQNWMVEPPTDRPVRAYVDGVYDLFHFGHAHSLEQAKKS